MRRDLEAAMACFNFLDEFSFGRTKHILKDVFRLSVFQSRFEGLLLL
jgi:hypothetical protein